MKKFILIAGLLLIIGIAQAETVPTLQTQKDTTEYTYAVQIKDAKNNAIYKESNISLKSGEKYQIEDTIKIPYIQTYTVTTTPIKTVLNLKERQDPTTALNKEDPAIKSFFILKFGSLDGKGNFVKEDKVKSTYNVGYKVKFSQNEKNILISVSSTKDVTDANVPKMAIDLPELDMVATTKTLDLKANQTQKIKVDNSHYLEIKRI